MHWGNMKTAILAVSFGTTHETAWKQTIGRLEEEIRYVYEGRCDVYCAYSSRKVIQSWKEKGRAFLSETEALKMLADQAYEAVIVLPTYLTAGYEYRRLKEQVAGRHNQFKKIILGAPLLTKDVYCKKLARALIEIVPFSAEETLVLMGHGTKGEGNEVYQRLQSSFNEVTEKTVAVTTMKQMTTEIRKRIQNKKVLLAPLLLTAGRHAEREMAGPQKESCKSMLEEAGYLVEVLDKGLGEYSQVRDIYLQQLTELYRQV